MSSTIVRLGPLSRDGHGGFWIAAYSADCTSCDNLTMLHYRAGVWSQVKLHIPGATVTALRLIPRSESLLASATGARAPGSQGDTVGAMLKYGP